MTLKLPRRAAVVLFICAAVVGSCGGGEPPVAVSSPSPTAAPTESPTPTPTPTPIATPKVWPLTGLAAAAAAQLGRRPLNVRLPNDLGARPQYGLNKADIVFELIVEGGVTRFSAIYHSKDADVIGPVRSYRWSDLHITQMLRGVIVASGATAAEADAVTQAIKDGSMVAVDEPRDPKPYYRVAFRNAPNNLFTSTAADRDAAARAGGSAPVDVPALGFLATGNSDPAAGGFAAARSAKTVTIPFQGTWASTYTWDAAANGYRRSQQGVRTVDGDGSGPILAKNVIVMTTDIWTTSVIEDSLGSLGLDYRMTGGGPVSVFRDGQRMDGTWTRDGVLDQFTFFDSAGNQLLLEPGQSWISFIYPTWSVTSTP